MVMVNAISALPFQGRVFSKSNNKGEAGVTVLLLKTDTQFRKSFVTDQEGFFSADVPKADEYTFRVLMPTGMLEFNKNVSIDNEVVTLYTDKVTKQKGINVEGEKEKTTLSRYKVRGDEIKRMPGTFGEALRGLETLPGIVAPPFGGGEIVIRGADPNTNTYVVDDLPILYPFHLLGLNSVVHNDLIKSIDVYTGAHPARFYNAIGGVIEIETVDSVTKTTGMFSSSLFSSNGIFQTPTFGGKGYLIAAGRVSYLENTIGLTGLVPDGIRLPQYHDSQVKFVHNFNPNHQISFTHLSSQDGFAARLDNKPNNDPLKETDALLAGARISIGRGFNTQGLRYTWTPSQSFTNKITLIRFDPFNKVNGALGSFSADQMTRTGYISIRQDAVWDISNFFKWEFGAEARDLQYNITGRTARQTDPSNQSPNFYDSANPAFQTLQLNDTPRTAYNYGYTTLKFQVGNFKFEPGTRYDYIGLTGKAAHGPRGFISYKFDNILKGLTVFSGGGLFSHFPNTIAWSERSGNPNLDWQKAKKYAGGIDIQLSTEWSLKTELFKQEYYNLIVNDPYIQGINPDSLTNLINPIRYFNFSNRGEGYSRGYELYIKKSNRPGTKDWFGWIAYTYSQTFRNTNIPISSITPTDRELTYLLKANSREIPYDFDLTHIVNVVYGWRFSEDYQLGVRMQYRTSAPYTPIVGDDGGAFRNPSTGYAVFNPTYSFYENSARQKPYQRIDVRIDRFLNYDWGYMNYFIEVINLLAIRNESGQNFNSTFPYSATNPSPQYDFSTLARGNTVIPLFNIGLEVKY